MCIYQYVQVIRYVTKYLHLIKFSWICCAEGVKESYCLPIVTLVVATVRIVLAELQPTEWVAVMHWDE